MSDRSKPWLDGPDFLDRHLAFASDEEGALAAAAPALARALCRVEWNVWGDCDVLCPCCCAPRLRGHEPTCYLDAALTAAGLGAEDREEVRREKA